MHMLNTMSLYPTESSLPDPKLVAEKVDDKVPPF